MDNLDDTENNAKISDSAYSNSCSNSQSRRSNSSKSTHSGSNSSGSSGYGGKPSTSGSSDNLSQPSEKRIKDTKKKKPLPAETIPVETPIEEDIKSPEHVRSADEADTKEPNDDACTLTPVHKQSEQGVEDMDTSTTSRESAQEETRSCRTQLGPENCAITCSAHASSDDGFSCVVSMSDGVVTYTTSSLSSLLGFPKDIWIGRSFIDFLHPRDRITFASQITSGLAVPKNVNAPSLRNSLASIVCRIRRYRGLTSGFSITDRAVIYVPFLLNLSFKNITNEEGKVMYLVIQATQFVSAFKSPHESISKAVPFVIRHSANGKLEYIDPQSVPYLGYLPQDILDQDALQYYHPDDLPYLRQVYETIIKEGGVPRSKIYRMLTHNGCYLKVETEWSSFINPWSRKLEFVIAKLHVIEGPANPNVFQTVKSDKSVKLSEEEKNKVQNQKEKIIRIMSEVLTKPTEAAKQNMSKRCQDLASFMESLIEEQPKADEELRLDIPDNSCCERDSVMLGGISPHHDYNDSKSSTETPLSYNQLNYNETLQRYFDSHQSFSYADYNTVTGKNILRLVTPKTVVSGCLSPMAQNSGDSGEMSMSDSGGISSGSAAGSLRDFHPMRLTETLITKHNADMEKELMKNHREHRSTNKTEREKVPNESRYKNKEHIARCFQTGTPNATTSEFQPHGVKRGSKQMDLEAGTNKHHCPSREQPQDRPPMISSPPLPFSAVPNTIASSQWQPDYVNNMNAYLLGLGVPQQMPVMSPVATVPGMFPVYYTPTAGTSMPVSAAVNPNPATNAAHFQQPFVNCVMYGQPVYGTPFMYSPVSPQICTPLQENLLAQTLQFSNTASMCAKRTNRDKRHWSSKSLSLRAKANTSDTWRERKEPKSNEDSTGNNTAVNAVNQESVKDNSNGGNGKEKSQMAQSSQSYNGNVNPGNSNCTPKQPAEPVVSAASKPNLSVRKAEETLDKTDGESSYSSFYSSFFKTESGSAEESVDANKVEKNAIPNATESTAKNNEPHKAKIISKRKMEPPWMEQVCVTSELVYKYQVLTKNLEEVLEADKQKMVNLEQPTLVNEQLGQLYLDLQLEGVASRLTLEEGITSSSSSGEEYSPKVNKGQRRKREYSKLVMIYEEDMPLPSEGEEESNESSNSALKC